MKWQGEAKNKNPNAFEDQLKMFTKGTESDYDAFIKALGLLKLKGEKPVWDKLDFL